MTIYIKRTFNYPPTGWDSTSDCASDDLSHATVFDDMLNEFHSTLKGLNVSVMTDDATSTVSTEHSEDLSTTSFEDMANSCVSTERASTESRTDFDAIPSAAEFSGIHAAESDFTVLSEFSETIASDYSDEDDIQLTFEPESVITINNEETSNMSTPTNRFEQLQEVDASEFEEFVPFLQDEQVAATLNKLAKCIRKVESLPEKIESIGNEISISEFLSVAMLQNRDIYAAIRDVLVRIGINCKPPGTTNGSPIWKKVVFTFWPDEKEEAGALYATNQRRAVELLVEKAREQDATALASTQTTGAASTSPRPLTNNENTDEDRAPVSARDNAIIGPLQELGAQLKAQSDLLTKLTQAIQIGVGGNNLHNAIKQTSEDSGVLEGKEVQSEKGTAALDTASVEISTKPVGQHAVAKGPSITRKYVGDARLNDPRYTNDPNFTRRRNAAALALEKRDAQGAPENATNAIAGRVRFVEQSEQTSEHNADYDTGEDDDGFGEDDDGFEGHPAYRRNREDQEEAHSTTWSEVRANGDRDAKRMHDAMKTIKAMFKDECFAGKPEDNWTKHQELFDEVAEPLGLTSKEKVQLFRHSLMGDALDFHRQSKGVKYKVWSKLVKVFAEKYASRIRKHENSTKLVNLNFNDHLKAKRGDHHSALDALVRRIETLSQMAKKRDQSEEAKVDFLIQAVRRTPWFLQADARLLAIDESDMTRTVDEMHGAINAVKTHNPEALAIDSDEDDGDRSKGILYNNNSSEDEDNGCKGEDNDADRAANAGAAIYFAGQKRYGRSHHGGKFSHNFAHKKHFGNQGGRQNIKADNRCFNCGKFNCRLNTCPEPKDQARIEANLQAWRANRNITKPLHKINLVHLGGSTADYAEALFAEQMLEAAKANTSCNFFTQASNGEQDKPIYLTSGSSALEDALKGNADMVWMVESMTSLSEEVNTVQNSRTGLEENDWFATSQKQLSPELDEKSEMRATHNEMEEVHLIQTRSRGNSSANNHDILTASTEEFDGVCLDCGASLSVVGKSQYTLYCNQLGFKPQSTTSESRFKFGESAFPAMFKFTFRLGLPDDTFMEFTVHVVEGNFPLLMGLEVMRQYGLVTDWGRDTLAGPNDEWVLPIQYAQGHAYVHNFTQTILFTRAELEKLHLHYHHPSADKLFNLIRRADPTRTDQSVKKLLEDISKACQQCQEYSSGPLRFRASLPPDQLIFNHEVAVDLVWLNRRAAMHFVDTHTNYQNATFIESKSAEALWKLFLNIWVTVYVGYPSTLRLDRESSFDSQTFRHLAESQGVVLQFSGVQSHNSIGKGEKYHDPLRRIFNKIKAGQPSIDDETALRLAIKASNDTMGPNGLVPTLLVYGSLPSLPIARSDNPTQKQRMKAMQTAKAEMETIVAEQRIKRALRSKIPPATKYHLKPGDKVRVYREELKKWIGPVKVVRIEDKIVFVTDGIKVKPFNIVQILPATSDRRDKELRDSLEKLYIFDKKVNNMYLTEVLQNKDPRCKSAKALEAVKKELDDLFKQNVFKVILEEDIPEDAVVLPSRMVYAIKNLGTELEKFKARLTAGGHRDFWKHYLVHDSTNLKHHSVRTITCVSTIKGWRIWSKDAKQAFVQESIDRPVVLRPAPEFQLPLNTYLLVLKYLYGLADSGDAWYHKLRAKLLQVLRLLTTTGDASFYYRRTEDGRLEGMLGTHVDDMLVTGSEHFKQNMQILDEHIKMTPADELPLTFAGVNIEEDNTNDRLVRKLHQRPYIDKLEPLPDNASFDDFRSMRHRLAWVTLTRPDIAASVAIYSQVTESTFNFGHIVQMNKTVKHLRSTASYCLRYSYLDLDRARIVVMTDGSHATNADSSSQLGFFIFLQEGSNISCLLYKSFKSKRIVRSPLAAETLALADGADAAILIRQDLYELTGIILPIELLTDAQSLFDVISKGTTTLEKRLMIDVRATREAFDDNTITFLGRIQRTYNIADPLTKHDSNSMMKVFMETGCIEYKVDQWIVRMDPDNSSESTN